jgi:peptidoglycan hydrolase-like protein with peptidoglycan-binding domain
VHEGTTDSDGYVTVPIVAKDEKLTLHVWDGDHEETYELALGSVDPADEMMGVQHRLMNLGYDVESEMGEPGELTQSAIADFQRTAGLPETGELDDVTRRRLMAVHGS